MLQLKMTQEQTLKKTKTEPKILPWLTDAKIRGAAIREESTQLRFDSESIARGESATRDATATRSKDTVYKAL